MLNEALATCQIFVWYIRLFPVWRVSYFVRCLYVTQCLIEIDGTRVEESNHDLLRNKDWVWGGCSDPTSVKHDGS